MRVLNQVEVKLTAESSFAPLQAHDVKNKVPSETPAAKEARLRQELKDSKRPLTPAPAAGEAATNGAVVNGDGEGPDSDNARLKKFHPVLNPVIMEVQKFFPTDSIKYMGAPFFVTFWQLSPYDIEVPINTYQHEIDRLLKADKELSRYPASAQVGDWQTDKVKLADKAKKLQEERSEQMELYATTRRRLATEKTLWFRSQSRLSSRTPPRLTPCRCVTDHVLFVRSLARRVPRPQACEPAGVPALHLPAAAALARGRRLLRKVHQDHARDGHPELFQSLVP